MPILSHALRAWGTEKFDDSLAEELKNLDTGILPLHQGTDQGGMVDDSNISVTVINAAANENTIRAKVGVFFTEIVGGCSCGDDPEPGNAYCELQVIIDKTTAEGRIRVIQD